MKSGILLPPIAAWIRARRSLDRDLIDNAGAIAIGSGTTALLGFAYWLLAARGVEAQSVGIAAAIISILAITGLVGDFGLGSFLLGATNGDSKAAPELIWSALWSSAVIGALTGLLALIVIHVGIPSIGPAISSSGDQAFFVASSALTSFCLVLDQGLVGLLDGRRQMIRNLLFSILKLVLLAALIVAAGAQAQPMGIVASWIVGKALATLLVLMPHPLLGGKAWRCTSFSELAGLGPTLLSHHGLNLASQIPALVMPVITISLVGATENAAFYAGWMLLQVASLVPASLSTVLYSVAVREPNQVPRRMRLSLSASAFTTLATIAGFVVLGSFALSIFRSEYAQIMNGAIQLFGLGLIGITVKCHFIAVTRMNNQHWSGTLNLVVGGLMEIGLAALGAHSWGLLGLTLGWLLGQAVSSVLMLPTIIRVVRL